FGLLGLARRLFGLLLSFFGFLGRCALCRLGCTCFTALTVLFGLLRRYAFLAQLLIGTALTQASVGDFLGVAVGETEQRRVADRALGLERLIPGDKLAGRVGLARVVNIAACRL